MAWIVPNPSGLNRGFTLDALVTAYAELREALRANWRGPAPIVL
jgi:TDG/mug DNA glycosylase family protein